MEGDAVESGDEEPMDRIEVNEDNNNLLELFNAWEEKKRACPCLEINRSCEGWAYMQILYVFPMYQLDAPPPLKNIARNLKKTTFKTLLSILI